jgi:origin recognition complex subunit 4
MAIITHAQDTLLLLEKRVKSRFSHRVWRVASPLAPEGAGWKVVLRRALVPWTTPEAAGESDKTTRDWMEDWTFAVDVRLLTCDPVTDRRRSSRTSNWPPASPASQV